ILNFFLARNILVALDRSWNYTVQSRGKCPEFFQPYVEEWSMPHVVDMKSKWCILTRKVLGGSTIRLLLVRWYTCVCVAKNPRTPQYLHRQYFEAKGMSEYHVTVFMEERKWDYSAFGLIASLLEGLPIIGLVFSISNRIGAAIWAHNLEKRRHHVTARLKSAD
ncbi:hypothetical protein BDQ17DRAFT_1249522, partial [Cyathus striatus]